MLQKMISNAHSLSISLAEKSSFERLRVFPFSSNKWMSRLLDSAKLAVRTLKICPVHRRVDLRVNSIDDDSSELQMNFDKKID